MRDLPGTREKRKVLKKKVRGVLTLLGKPHTLSILSHFVHRAKNGARFTEIKSRLGLPPNTLSRRLKELEGAGLLTRHEHNEVPPRVDYVPTQAAISLCCVLSPLRAWLQEHDSLSD